MAPSKLADPADWRKPIFAIYRFDAMFGVFARACLGLGLEEVEEKEETEEEEDEVGFSTKTLMLKVRLRLVYQSFKNLIKKSTSTF